MRLRFRVASGLLKLETMLEINGFPWEFELEDVIPTKSNNHYKLMERQKELLLTKRTQQ